MQNWTSWVLWCQCRWHFVFWSRQVIFSWSSDSPCFHNHLAISTLHHNLVLFSVVWPSPQVCSITFAFFWRQHPHFSSQHQSLSEKLISSENQCPSSTLQKHLSFDAELLHSEFSKHLVPKPTLFFIIHKFRLLSQILLVSLQKLTFTEQLVATFAQCHSGVSISRIPYANKKSR